MNTIYVNYKIILAFAISIAIVSVFGIINVVTAPNDFVINQPEILLEAEQELEIVEKEITIMFVGDIMLSRFVNTKMERANDYNWPFLEISDYLNEADLVVGNLESPFIINTNSYHVESGSFSFKTNPKAIEGLLNANFGMLSLANNHTINQGKQGIIDTIAILDENNIFHAGAGINEHEARRPAVIELNNNSFAFLSYAYPNDYSLATESRHGIASMNIEKMQNDVKNLLDNTDPPEQIIVLMHAGTEYVLEPNWQQKAFARAAIDAGADMVVGHHPHWPQLFETYNDKPIIYSLGNFVFDQMWSEKTRQGLIMKMTWQNELKELQLIPTKIYDYGQVRIVDNENERLDILSEIQSLESGIIYSKD